MSQRFDLCTYRDYNSFSCAANTPFKKSTQRCSTDPPNRYTSYTGSLPAWTSGQVFNCVPGYNVFYSFGTIGTSIFYGDYFIVRDSGANLAVDLSNSDFNEDFYIVNNIKQKLDPNKYVKFYFRTIVSPLRKVSTFHK